MRAPSQAAVSRSWLLPTLTAIENAALPMDFTHAGSRPNGGNVPNETWRPSVWATKLGISPSNCPEVSSSGWR